MLRSMFGAPVIFLNMMRHERESLYITMSFIIFNVVLNLILIPKFGVVGAALATGIVIVGKEIALCYRLAKITGIRSSIIGQKMMIQES